MSLAIDLSVTPHVAIPVRVSGWPVEAQHALRDRLDALPAVVNAALADDEITVMISRDGANISGLKQLVREAADDLLPGEDLLYRY